MRRNRLMTVQQQDEQDQFAETEAEWSDLRQEWFSLVPLSGEEYQHAQQTHSQVTHEGRCPYFAGANSQLRLTSESDSRVFHVESVINENERNRDLLWRLVEVS